MAGFVEAVARCPGSCGELVEGSRGGHSFLITCPVNIYSYVKVTLDRNIRGITGPHDRVKTVAAVEKTLEYMGVKGIGGWISVDSQIPVGAGMASSTADITAACMAASAALGKELSMDEIADIALSIEPSDGVMYKGIVAFDFIKGSIREFLGMPPPIDILIADMGGRVETLDFYKRDNLGELNKKREPEVLKAADLVTRGIKLGDPDLIGRGATISALANQDLLLKPQLPNIIDIAKELGALGVNTAHSGTVIGIMFSTGSIVLDDVERIIKLKVRGVKRFFKAKITGEGPQVIRKG